MTIAEVLKIYGLSQTGMSRELGIPLRTVQDWAGGKHNPPEWALKLIVEHYQRDGVQVGHN